MVGYTGCAEEASLPRPPGPGFVPQDGERLLHVLELCIRRVHVGIEPPTGPVSDGQRYGLLCVACHFPDPPWMGGVSRGRGAAVQ